MLHRPSSCIDYAARGGLTAFTSCVGYVVGCSANGDSVFICHIGDNRTNVGTLQPTILANDAWLKLFPDGKAPKFKNRKHFFGAAATVMRRELVDHARKRDAIKRGEKVEISETQFANLEVKATDETVLAVDEALEKFAKTDKATASLVELRFFLGFTMKDAAKQLGISLSSAERDFAYFKAWFLREYGKKV